MANKRFEMYENRHIVIRMGQGDSDWALSKAGLIGRPKAKTLRAVVEFQGWLDPKTPLPDEAVFAKVLDASAAGKPTPSSVEPYRSVVPGRVGQDIQ
jgi:hypothetical protein